MSREEVLPAIIRVQMIGFQDFVSCSCCQDGTQSLSLPWWCVPCVQISWPWYWCH